MEKYVFDIGAKKVIKKFFQGMSDNVRDMEIFQNYGSDFITGFYVLSWESGAMTLVIGDEGNIHIHYGKYSNNNNERGRSRRRGKESWKDLIDSYSGKEFLKELGKHIINRGLVKRRAANEKNEATKSRRIQNRKSVANIFHKMGITGNPKYGPSRHVLNYLNAGIVKPSPINKNHLKGGRKTRRKRRQRGGQVVYTPLEGRIISDPDAIPTVASLDKYKEDGYADYPAPTASEDQ
jgi:hypothetical protein